MVGEFGRKQAIVDGCRAQRKRFFYHMKMIRLSALILCLACLAACSALPGIAGTTQGASTPTTASVFATLTALPDLRTPSGNGILPSPPGVAAFCPSSRDLAPLVGETMVADVGTQTTGSTTTCGYKSATGFDTAEFDITAFADVPSAQSSYMQVLHDAQQVGQAETVSGVGDAAFYFVGEAVYALKGTYNLVVKFYYLHQGGTHKQVDVAIARMLADKV
ncbi:MAG TPA: hypothetical protein VGF38_19860 [Ktedonobacterales bacterium]|jgi:hypothetical protein